MGSGKGTSAIPQMGAVQQVPQQSQGYEGMNDQDLQSMFGSFAVNDTRLAQMESERLAGIESSRLSQGGQDVDTWYGYKFDAADKATDEVNSEIAAEASHAELMGLDYSQSEEQKMDRINNRFATYWSEADEQQLTTFSGEFGEGENIWDSGIVRGTSDTDTRGSVGDTTKSAGKRVAALGTKTPATSALGSEDEALGGA